MCYVCVAKSVKLIKTVFSTYKTDKFLQETILRHYLQIDIESNYCDNHFLFILGSGELELTHQLTNLPFLVPGKLFSMDFDQIKNQLKAFIHQLN